MTLKYFKPDKNWQYNSRITKTDNKWLFYGEGYRLASELLEKQILEIDPSNQDFLIYPYCYLMRHYVEIRLKEVIDEGNKLTNTTVDPTKGGHDLVILWNRSQLVLAEVWKDQHEKAPQNISDFINELHAIDVKSDCFRYPIDKNGNETLSDIPQINFKKLSEVFQEVKWYLDGITDGLAAARDNFGA